MRRMMLDEVVQDSDTEVQAGIDIANLYGKSLYLWAIQPNEVVSEEQRPGIPDICAPIPEPAVRSVYVDCRHPFLPLGYSDTPVKTRVVNLARERYTTEEAEARFEEMRAENNWRVVGERFWTARFWSWRVADGR